MRSLEKLRSRVETLAIYLGAAALILLLVLTITNILFRLGGLILSGSYELAEMIIPVVAVSAILIATLHGAHVAVDLVVDQLSERMRRRTAILVTLCGAAYWAAMTYASAGIAAANTRLGEYTELFSLPIAPLRWLWVFISSSVALILFATAIGLIKGPEE